MVFKCSLSNMLRVHICGYLLGDSYVNQIKHVPQMLCILKLCECNKTLWALKMCGYTVFLVLKGRCVLNNCRYAIMRVPQIYGYSKVVGTQNCGYSTKGTKIAIMQKFKYTNLWVLKSYGYLVV